MLAFQFQTAAREIQSCQLDRFDRSDSFQFSDQNIWIKIFLDVCLFVCLGSSADETNGEVTFQYSSS